MKCSGRKVLLHSKLPSNLLGILLNHQVMSKMACQQQELTKQAVHWWAKWEMWTYLPKDREDSKNVEIPVSEIETHNESGDKVVEETWSQNWLSKRKIC
jgi:hypothetical protein